MTQSAVQLVLADTPALSEQLDVGPDVDVESWRLRVPARGACYVLEDGEGRPVLLATCGDLRRALTQRLGPQEADAGPVKKIDYRAVVRRVRWREAFSRFEADWAYIENARALLPRTYRRLIKRWRVHWVRVDLDAAHPRVQAVDRPGGTMAMNFGPLSDGRAARQVVQTLEDLLDLCRYHHILIQAPDAQACAYKQMGRCPAPCDGSIGMEEYRHQVRQAAAFLSEGRDGERGAWVGRLTDQMMDAARRQHFEEAARIKQQVERMRALCRGEFAAMQPLNHLQYLTLQRGRGKGSVRVFLIAPGRIAFAGQVDRKGRDERLEQIAAEAGAWFERPALRLDDGACERIGLAGWSLLHARPSEAYLHARDACDPHTLSEAAQNLWAAGPRGSG